MKKIFHKIGDSKMLVIHCNNNFKAERRYIFDCVFCDFWHMDYEIIYESRSNIEIESSDGRCLHIADTFLQMDDKAWLSVDSMPMQPLRHLIVPESYAECVTDRDLPIIFGDNGGELFSIDEMYCSLDIFGSALFMLTRYEEVVNKERDDLDRFFATASLAYQEGFLERPIVNEYLEIMWQWLHRHFQGLERKEKRFSIMPTHDVDNPFWCMSVNWLLRIKMLAGDILKRRNLLSLKKHIDYIRMAINNDYSKDPYNTFDLIMDISEKYKLTSCFYFMTAQGRDVKDGNYDIMHNAIRKIVKKILNRGHKIGIHPGFNSKDKAELIIRDTDRLRELIATENLPVSEFGGRQHFLHWSAPLTWNYYAQAGIQYDTTLGYADHIGFRCGICYDYPVYDVVAHEVCKLREYPLAAMEVSGLAERYMNLSREEMLRRCRELRRKTQKYQGVFVILWHNTSFVKNEDLALYKGIIGEV